METPAPETVVRGRGCTALRQQQQQRTVSDNEETASLLHFISVASCNIKMALDRPSRNKRKVNHRKYLQKQLKTCGEASRKGSSASPVVTTTTTTTNSSRNNGTMGLPFSSAFPLSDSPGIGPTLPHGHAARPHRRETSHVGLQVKSLNALFDPKTLMELRNLAEGEGRLGDPRDSCYQQAVRTGVAGGGGGGAGGTHKVSLRSRNLPASFFVEPALRSCSLTGSAEAGARDGERGGHRDAALTPCSLAAMDRAGPETCAGPDRLQSPQFLLQQQPQPAPYNLNCDGGASNSCGSHVGDAGTGLGGPCYPPVLMSDALESILGQQELSELLCGGQWHQRDGASLPPCDTASAGPCSPRSLSDSSSSEAFCPQPSPSPGAPSSASSSSSSTPSSCASSACSPSWSPGFYFPPTHHAGPLRPHGWTGTKGEDPLSSSHLFVHQRFFAAMDSCSPSDIRLPQQALSKQLLQQHQRHQLIQLNGVQRNVPDHHPHYPHLQQQIQQQQQQQQQQQHQRLYAEGQYSMLSSHDLQQTASILDEQIPVLCSSPPASVLAPDASNRHLSVPAFNAPFGCEPSPPQCAQPPSLGQHQYAPSHSVALHPLPSVSQLSPHQPQQHKFLELPTFPQTFSPCGDGLQAFKQQQLPYEGAAVECASPLGWNYGGSENSFGSSATSQSAFFAYDVC